jgi:hypothetical protein
MDAALTKRNEINIANNVGNRKYMLLMLSSRFYMIFRTFVHHFAFVSKNMHDQYDYRNYTTTKQYSGFEDAMLSKREILQYNGEVHIRRGKCPISTKPEW